MNAIIALCHFCDHHGPTTLFCTQAFKYSDYQSMNANKLNERIGILLESAPPGAHSPDLSDQENKIMGANVSPSQSEAAQPSSNCKACQAFDKNFHHYISYDNSTNFPNSPNQICYLSQSSPNVSEVFALVRKACLRTLHCEVFEDPIFFDDDKNGSVIGYEFIIKDIEGRGWQRSYSLIIIMRDRIYLQHLWSFLSKQMSIIATNLKEQAEKKFQKDLFERGLSPTGNPAQILSFKKTSKQVRGLVELTDDPLIFAKLHMWFTWMLRMCSCQISEEFMHGPLSEDSQIKCEREKLRELSIDESESQKLGLLMINMFNKDPFVINDSKALFQMENREDLIKKLCDLVVIEGLRQLFKLANVDKFHQIAYNVIIGNQVIVRGKHKRLVESVVRVLEGLIPLGCCKSVYFSHQYLKSYECKLLGLSDQVYLFKDADKDVNYVLDDLNEFILIDLSIDSQLKIDPQNLQINFESINSQTLSEYIEYKINFELCTNVKNATQIPSIQTKIESYLSNESLDDESVMSLIRLAKEEWLNKTKVFYKYLLSPNVNNSVSIESVLTMLNLGRNDELALKYWQAGLSQECKMQIRSS